MQEGVVRFGANCYYSYMSTVSQADIAHLANLARLTLTEEEKNRYAGQLSNVISYVEQLQEVSTEGVNAAAGVTGMSNVLAADVPREKTDAACINPETALASVPSRNGNFIQVRAVLNTDGGAA